ncbi:MAG: acyltransferase [Sphingobacteriales bacterium]|nr:acyltransferase [Sphingobacteriales bacterium]
MEWKEAVILALNLAIFVTIAILFLMGNSDYRLKNIYLPQFDGFRGFFCFTILIIHHHFYYVNIPSNIGYFTMHSFFIMSSFLITRTLMIDKKRSDSFKTFFVKFYIKRTLRIFPVYFAYLAFTVFIALLTARTLYKPILGIFYEIKYFGWMLLSFTYNFKDLYCLFTGDIYNKSLVFPHLWSLSLEEQFYIIVPFMIYFMSEKAIKRLCIAMIILFPIIRIIGFNWLGTLTDDNMHRSFILYRCTIFQYDAFFYGTALALFDVKWSDITMNRVFYLLLFIFILTVPVNGWILHQRTGENFIHIITSYEFMTRNGQYIYIDTLVNLLCVSFFYICFKDETRFNFFKNRFIVDVGARITYSSYVYQYIFIIPVLIFIKPYIDSTHGIVQFTYELVSILLSISCLLLLSHFSYNSLESHFLKKKDKYLAKYKK